MLAERRLQRDFENLQDNLSKLMADFNSLAKEKGSDAVDSMKETIGLEREKIEAMLGTAGESLKVLQERAKDATHDVEDKIKENPLLAVAAALGIGFLVGKLLSPGRR
jgi:ElaB/YqjD/DUF883 family membrane-anchored ribosome-binding protein